MYHKLPIFSDHSFDSWEKSPNDQSRSTAAIISFIYIYSAQIIKFTADVCCMNQYMYMQILLKKIPLNIWEFFYYNLCLSQKYLFCYPISMNKWIIYNIYICTYIHTHVYIYMYIYARAHIRIRSHLRVTLFFKSSFCFHQKQKINWL